MTRGLVHTLLALCLFAPLASGLAQDRVPVDVDCALLPAKISTAGAKCRAQQGVKNEGGRVFFGGEFVVVSPEVIAVVLYSEDPQTYVQSATQAEFIETAGRFFSKIISTNTLSAVFTVDNAWAATFSSAGRSCVVFDNYSRPYLMAYKWRVLGVSCEPGAKEFSPGTVRPKLSLVVPNN